MQLLAHQPAAEGGRRQFEAAGTVQLPSLRGTLDLADGLDIAARNHPAFAVSGDYYDCQVTGTGEVAFTIGDVMGAGLAAATLVTCLRSAFHAGVKRGLDLQSLDWRLNEVMQSVSEAGRFATGILGRCDLANGVLVLTCAGHPWPSVFCGGERIPPVDAAWTLPWGLPLRRRTLRPARIRLSGRLSLLAYTDGLSELTNACGEPYSAKRLEEYHAAHLDCTADRLCDAVLDDVLKHAGPARPLADDMTVLAIRGTP